MNPNDSTQNSGVDQNNGGSPFITPTPIGFDVLETNAGNNPVNPQQPPVSPMPAPQPQSSVVTPTPMPAAPTTVTPTPMSTTPVADDVTKEDPNAKLTEVNIPPSAGSSDVEPKVINTKKAKGSNIVIFIVIIILVAFAVNIDKMSEMYDNYMKTGSLTYNSGSSDNTSDGFIKIGEASSSLKVGNINFYNFRKNAEDSTISFNYEAFARFEKPSKLNIYVAIYNANKQILYKELFDTGDVIEMNTTANYTLTLDSDILNDAFYALVKIYSGLDLNAASNVTCKFKDSDYQYENKYYFVGEGLVKYDVTKISFAENDTELENEYRDLVKNGVNAKLSNKTLKYTIDLSNESKITPVYEKGLTPTVVKTREATKEWICE